MYIYVHHLPWLNGIGGEKPWAGNWFWSLIISLFSVKTSQQSIHSVWMTRIIAINVIFSLHGQKYLSDQIPLYLALHIRWVHNVIKTELPFLSDKLRKILVSHENSAALIHLCMCTNSLCILIPILTSFLHGYMLILLLYTIPAEYCWNLILAMNADPRESPG